MRADREKERNRKWQQSDSELEGKVSSEFSQSGSECTAKVAWGRLINAADQGLVAPPPSSEELLFNLWDVSLNNGRIAVKSHTYIYVPRRIYSNYFSDRPDTSCLFSDASPFNIGFFGLVFSNYDATIPQINKLLIYSVSTQQGIRFRADSSWYSPPQDIRCATVWWEFQNVRCGNKVSMSSCGPGLHQQRVMKNRPLAPYYHEIFWIFLTTTHSSVWEFERGQQGVGGVGVGGVQRHTLTSPLPLMQDVSWIHPGTCSQTSH